MTCTACRGGGAIMVAPNSIGITRSLVRELAAEQGIDAYHGAQWRTRLAERLTAETEYGAATELLAEEGVVGTEVLTNAGDMIVFDRKRLSLLPLLPEPEKKLLRSAMCVHAASRCTNGCPRCELALPSF